MKIYCAFPHYNGLELKQQHISGNEFNSHGKEFSIYENIYDVFTLYNNDLYLIMELNVSAEDIIYDNENRINSCYNIEKIIDGNELQELIEIFRLLK